MRPIHSFHLAFFLLATGISNAQFTDVINSNRPGQSMAAFSVGKTVIQAEAGIYGIDQRDKEADYSASGFGGDLSVRYGAFFEQLEFILEAQYQKDNFTTPTQHFNRSGITELVLGAKFLVYDPNKNYEKKPDLHSWKANHSFSWHEFIPAVGIYGGMNLNLFDGDYERETEKISPKVMVITQNQFGKWVFVTNFGLDKVATEYQGYEYIITLTRGFNPRWSAFIEHQGAKNDYYKDMIFRGGAAYLIKENIQVDAFIGSNVYNDPSRVIGGIGVSWRFDENYKEVLLRAPKDEKEDKKSKEEKKKEKDAKKRKDAVEGTETK